MAGSLGRISVLLWVMVTLLASTSGSGKVVPVEAVALHPSMHTLVVNAILDTPCRQQCFLLLHALENVQRDGDLDGPVQLLGNATLLQVNTVSVNQLPAATYRLTVSCSNASTCSSQPTFLHFSRLPSGKMATTGINAHATADADLPQVQVLESSFRVVHGHGISAISKEQSKEGNAWEKNWLQGGLLLCLLALQVSSLVLS